VPAQVITGCTVLAVSIGGLPAHCPPSGHVEAEGTFYRFSASSLAVGDRVPVGQWGLPVNNRMSEAFEQWNDCDGYAHSVFASLEPLVSARKVLHWAKKRSICKLELVPGMGRVHESPSDVGPEHYDWYPDPLDRVPTAVVVEARP